MFEWDEQRKILFDFSKKIIKLLSSFVAVSVHSVWYVKVSTDQKEITSKEGLK